MEVILAMALFFVAGAVVYSGLSASYEAVERVRYETQAADLAVSKLSELQMGLSPMENQGPEGYEDEDLADWTWEVVVEDSQDEVMAGFVPELSQRIQVEVIISNTTARMRHRLYHVFWGAVEP